MDQRRAPAAVAGASVDEGGNDPSVGKTGADLRADGGASSRDAAGNAQIDDDGLTDIGREIAKEQRRSPLARNEDCKTSVAVHVAGCYSARNGAVVEAEVGPYIVKLAVAVRDKKPIMILSGKIAVGRKSRP